MTDIPRPVTDTPAPEESRIHDADALLGGHDEARIALGEQTYTLRRTRAGKLLLTK